MSPRGACATLLRMKSLAGFEKEFSANLWAEVMRLGGHAEPLSKHEAPVLFGAVNRIRFDGALVLHEAWGISYFGLMFGPFEESASDVFFKKYAVQGVARSDEVALWARTDSSAADPLVCVREHDEDQDDFDAIESEGRLFRPLSEILARASLDTVRT